MLVLRMLVSPALPPSPTTTVDVATRPGVQVLKGRGGGVVDGGLEARRRVPGGQDEAVPVAQVPRPHARRGGAPRDQLQEHRAAQRVSCVPDRQTTFRLFLENTRAVLFLFVRALLSLFACVFWPPLLLSYAVCRN